MAGAYIGCKVAEVFSIAGCIMGGAVGSQVLGIIGGVYGWSEGQSDNPYADPLNTGQPGTGEDPLEAFRF